MTPRPTQPASGPKPYLELFFRCANFYQRVYRNAEGTGYQARCPACAKCVRFRVGQGGTRERRFVVDCTRSAPPSGRAS